MSAKIHKTDELSKLLDDKNRALPNNAGRRMLSVVVSYHHQCFKFDSKDSKKSLIPKFRVIFGIRAHFSSYYDNRKESNQLPS